MYVLVIFILDSRLAIFFFLKKLSFWLSACRVLIMVPLLYVRSSFSSASWTEGVR